MTGSLTRAAWIIGAAVDAEPLVATRGWLVDQEGPRLLAGLAALRTRLGGRAVLAVAGAARAKLLAASAPEGVEVRDVGDGFPLDDPAELAWDVAGVAVRPEQSAADAGVVVVRAAELAAGPGRPLTVTGAVARPYVARVKPDATVEALVDHAGGALGEAWVALAGGPMRGALVDRDLPLPPEAEALIVLPADHEVVRARKLPVGDQVRRALGACEGCGLCTAACPPAQRGWPVSPLAALRALTLPSPSPSPSTGARIDHSGHEARAVESAALCTHCGLCDLVCPAGLSPAGLLDGYRAALAGDAALAARALATPMAAPTEGGSRRLSRGLLTLRLGLSGYASAAALG
ncbi:MAG: 4Fe-4S dicluster domain-containing protein [Deltaproteobacteria bacterium]|nr:4Fe-4S dicluster domain-containing protein [Deltaproteobacteria bacterium]